MPAGEAILSCLLGLKEPIARLVLCVGTEADRSVRRRKWSPVVPVSLERGDLILQRQVPQPSPAALAPDILEIERLPAGLAFEKLHGFSQIMKGGDLCKGSSREREVASVHGHARNGCETPRFRDVPDWLRICF
jgi:hypothetical protein